MVVSQSWHQLTEICDDDFEVERFWVVSKIDTQEKGPFAVEHVDNPVCPTRIAQCTRDIGKMIDNQRPDER